jgi:MEDS: MEthanogen/methylotroph, DcmR Sensory domain
MTVRECVGRGEAASEHIVQFFDSDESRAESVAAFLAEGYRLGEPLIVVARPINWAAIVERLEALDVPVQTLISERTLIIKDANDTLRRLSRNGMPDAAAFDAVVGVPVTELARRGRVRAYGEMVDILAQRTELPEAIKLETLWNALGERASIYLLCGYSAAHFVATSTHRALRQICRTHARVHRSAQDPLAVWLLKSAHNPSLGDSVTLT